MQLMIGHSEAVADFVARQIGMEPFGDCLAQGVIDGEGRLVGGFVWNGYDAKAGIIEMSGAAITPRWLTRDVLTQAFNFMFDGVGVQLIMSRNKASNVRVHRQLERIGFERRDVPRLFGRKEDGVIWFLTDDVWRASPFNAGSVH